MYTTHYSWYYVGAAVCLVEKSGVFLSSAMRGTTGRLESTDGIW